ncbi:2-dehydropantoate 2-reductase [Sediminibacillus massiliensis]|uniref:2-dehydropantoate 2-reductase n=1 Tax=Sediminibacillus massiliensis TaxID=1926277 RepID=UPI0009883613|nr:2-dehydropantoate 2-reductase [Sediminibacillus massiliensis]
MDIGIIGGGAVGLLTAAYFAKENHRVTIYVNRESQMTLIRKQGIILLPLQESFYIEARLVSELKREDLLFIGVKQYHLEEVFPVLQEKSGAPLVFMQNGMGHIPLISGLDVPQAILTAVTEHGAVKMADNKVEHTGMGNMKMAVVKGELKNERDVQSALDRDWFPVEIVESWFSIMAEKLVVNAVINPLTAIFQVENGMILTNPHLAVLAKRLCAEASGVLGLDEKKQWIRVLEIIEKTGANHSSMKKDIQLGRKTEIDGISGYLLSQSSVYLPYTTFAYQSVKALESKGERG